MSYQEIIMGSDPELAVVDSTNGKIVPASKILDRFFEIENIELSKQFRVNNFAFTRDLKDTRVGPVHYIKSIGSLSDIVVDGISFEINTRPTHCKRGEVKSIASGINLINKILDKVNETDSTSLKVNISPSIYVSDENLKDFPEQAAQFGCDPDRSIYNVKECKTIDATKHNMRYFGGHLHMSARKITPEWLGNNVEKLTMILDRVVGIGTTAVNRSPEEQLRRQMYGDAGRIRLQPYGGLEYRTPSNSWLLDSSLQIFTLHLVQIACNLAFEENNELFEALDDTENIYEVIRIINAGDTDAAMKLFSKTMETIQHGKGILNLCNAYPENYLRFAQYVYDKGGAHEVFDPNTASNRWASAGFYPGYDQLRGVDRFVFTVIEPKDRYFLSGLTYEGMMIN